MSEEEVMPSELDLLKERASKLGITFHPSIGVEKLRDKVAAAMSDTTEEEEEEKEVVEKPVAAVQETKMQRITRLRQDAERLIRIRVTCMNPAKKEWLGEIVSVGNRNVGTIKKYIPFNSDEGWHVPNIVYQQLRDKQCQIFVNVKTKNGVTVRQGKLIKEYAIEVLPDLTPAELKDLAQRQAMANSVE